MRIGVPKEIKAQESRVGLTPDSVKILTSNGHEVLVENNGGFEAGFYNEQYKSAGAKIIDKAEDVFNEKKDRYQYSRFDNPTVNQLEKKFAKLEGAESCRAFSSGMSAVFASLMCQTKKGDRVVSSKALFG